jgi:hypothetical protein
MRFNRKLLIITSLAGVVSLCVAATGRTTGDNHFTNLRVLPKNISSKELSAIMVDEFNDGLGVGCNFCHAEEKDSHRLDYASDEKPEKEMARSMMRMTMRINKRFFRQKHPVIGDSLQVVTCTTCHRGEPRPEGK